MGPVPSYGVIVRERERRSSWTPGNDYILKAHTGEVNPVLTCFCERFLLDTQKPSPPGHPRRLLL